MKKYFVGNWKMSLGKDDTLGLFRSYQERFSDLDNDIEIISCPTSLYLPLMDQNISQVSIGAQDCSIVNEYSANTGEISAKQISELGNVKYGIVGHSERRIKYNESDEIIAGKFQNYVDEDITPILCVSETEEQREGGLTQQVITNQIAKAISKIDSQSDYIIAYEPAWAISTSDSKRIVEVRDVVEVAELISRIVGAEIPILYGGSVNRDNAKSFIDIENISGLIIGGASLDVDHMSDIIREA